jgi:hypothetical protein
VTEYLVTVDNSLAKLGVQIKVVILGKVNQLDVETVDHKVMNGVVWCAV